MSFNLMDANQPAAQFEQVLTQLWRDTLQLPAINLEDSFFALGGDSLAAKRMLSQIQRRFGVECSLVEFFDADTVASLSALLLLKASSPSKPIDTDNAQFEEGTI